MFGMLITSILAVSALTSSTLLFKMLNVNKKLSQLEFQDLENEIADLRLEYEKAKKFKKLTNEIEVLEKAINEIYEEKTKPLDTSDFVNKIEENRKKLYFNIPTKEELQEGNIKVYYKKEIDDFIKMHEGEHGYHYLSLEVDEHDNTGSIIREVICNYKNVKEYSYYASSRLNGNKGIQVERYCSLEVYINKGCYSIYE
ncbi:hypothetical protein [Macrococcoides caseolyticum]|uniref:Uncharacterized protein n=1 Tax=Macrococcoides caseolyticum TaxID=69966 RepID=A0ACC9MNU9_9STAP|nr:hypothetical protein [Macrococcus caseolyticus]PKE40485.1 hypothetical protein CW675_01880 [Macrococcus caseolyticus]PKE55311.1 hypothetical protein CW682_12265 [Macrococcus caseolyticus]